MKFKIDSKVLEKFSGLNLGLVVVKGLDNQGVNEEILNLIREKEKEIKADFDKETLSENEKIKSWREAYSSFGAKPKKYKCSVENLYRMILDEISMKHINKLVDLYNYISIKYLIPVGGDDLDQIEGNITLKLAQGDESFKELNSDEIKNPKEGEVVYADDQEVLCRRWNWRECDKSKMTEDTKKALLVVEGLPPVTKEEIKKIIKELSELVEKCCDGETKIFILNQEKPEVEIKWK